MTIGTYNFVLVILNVVLLTSLPTVDITKFLVQFNLRCILQLISGISNDLKKMDRYFSGTTIFQLGNNLLVLAISGLVLAVESLERRLFKRFDLY